MNTHNVNVKTATPESPKTWDEKPAEQLTQGQFRDLCSWLFRHGKFRGPCGLNWRDLERFEEMADPSGHPDAMTLYLHDGWPVAVYEFDTGYTMTGGAL